MPLKPSTLPFGEVLALVGQIIGRAEKSQQVVEAQAAALFGRWWGMANCAERFRLRLRR